MPVLLGSVPSVIFADVALVAPMCFHFSLIFLLSRLCALFVCFLLNYCLLSLVKLSQNPETNEMADVQDAVEI